MSNPAAATASHYALADDGSPASLLARALRDAEAELDVMREKYRASQTNANALSHEVERIRSMVRPVTPEKIWPVHIRCDGKGCVSVVAFDPAPEEARMCEALRALGWDLWEADHFCRECRR